MTDPYQEDRRWFEQVSDLLHDINSELEEWLSRTYLDTADVGDVLVFVTAAQGAVRSSQVIMRMAASALPHEVHDKTG